VNTTYVDGDEMDLGMTVFTGLGGRHVDDLARAAWVDSGVLR